MSAALGLFRLQRIDGQIAQVEVRLAQIRQTLDDNAELQAAMQQLQAAEQEQRSAERAQRSSEDDAQSQHVKIQQAESSLYSGTVRNPKELQDLQVDVASLKKHLASIEDRELQDMLRTEAAQQAAKDADQQLQRVRARLGSEHHQLNAEKESQDVALARLQAERQAAVSAVASELLRTYDELRVNRRGVAVAEVADNACSACGTTLTAAIQQSARHSAVLVHCPSCGRILYAA